MFSETEITRFLSDPFQRKERIASEIWQSVFPFSKEYLFSCVFSELIM
jgi:hypothetical protein